MKIKIYVNHESHEVLSEADFEAMAIREGKERADNIDSFSEWLDENYSSSELFYMTESKRTSVIEEWKKVAYGDAWDDLTCPYGGEWKVYEVEV